MRKSHKYCDHNKVRQSYADGGKVEKKPTKKKPKPTPEMLGDGMAASAGKTLRDKRKQQMEDLGI